MLEIYRDPEAAILTTLHEVLVNTLEINAETEVLN
jgi:hypothetical protein